jgi:hypothetical protein
LARVSAQLQQLASSLKPLAAESQDKGLVTEALGMLFDWLSDERESATAAPRSIGYPETSGDPRNS